MTQQHRHHERRQQPQGGQPMSVRPMHMQEQGHPGGEMRVAERQHPGTLTQNLDAAALISNFIFSVLWQVNSFFNKQEYTNS